MSEILFSDNIGAYTLQTSFDTETPDRQGAMAGYRYTITNSVGGILASKGGYRDETSAYDAGESMTGTICPTSLEAARNFIAKSGLTLQGIDWEIAKYTALILQGQMGYKELYANKLEEFLVKRKEYVNARLSVALENKKSNAGRQDMWLAGFRIWEHDAAAEVEPDLRDIIVLIAEYREEFKITEEAPLGNRPAGPSQAQDRWQALTENIREIQNPTLRYTVEDGRLGMSI